MTTDPVCGMQVDEAKAAARAEHQGVIYYFCSRRCHEAFLQQPEKYVRAGDRPRPGGQGGTS